MKRKHGGECGRTWGFLIGGGGIIRAFGRPKGQSRWVQVSRDPSLSYLRSPDPDKFGEKKARSVRRLFCREMMIVTSVEIFT